MGDKWQQLYQKTNPCQQVPEVSVLYDHGDPYTGVTGAERRYMQPDTRTRT